MTNLKWERERNDGMADSTHQKGRMHWVGQKKWRIVVRRRIDEIVPSERKQG